MKSLSAAKNSNKSRICRVVDVDEEATEPPSTSKTIKSRTYGLVNRRSPVRYRNHWVEVALSMPPNLYASRTHVSVIIIAWTSCCRHGQRRSRWNHRVQWSSRVEVETFEWHILRPPNRWWRNCNWENLNNLRSHDQGEVSVKPPSVFLML
jgi:hypothetical protein